MKELKRLLKRYKSRILSAITLVLLAATIGLALMYLVSDAMNPSMIFFVGAVLMADLALNYAQQKKKNKGVFVFYTLAVAACIVLGCILRTMPLE